MKTATKKPLIRNLQATRESIPLKGIGIWQRCQIHRFLGIFWNEMLNGCPGGWKLERINGEVGSVGYKL